MFIFHIIQRMLKMYLIAQIIMFFIRVNKLFGLITRYQKKMIFWIHKNNDYDNYYEKIFFIWISVLPPQWPFFSLICYDKKLNNF